MRISQPTIEFTMHCYTSTVGWMVGWLSAGHQSEDGAFARSSACEDILEFITVLPISVSFLGPKQTNTVYTQVQTPF